MVKDIQSIGKEKKIIIFGTAGAAKQLIEPNPGITVAYFVDNAKRTWGTYFNQCIVTSTTTLPEETQDKFAVIVSSNYYRDT